MKLKVEYVPIGTVKEYENNAKLHPAEQIQQIKESIRQFGNCDPIGVWHDPEKGDVIVEGHGRLQALTEMGETEIPIIRLDHLTDEQRKAYALVHNKLTMNSDFDTDTLLSELDDILDIDMSEFGFDFDEEFTEDDLDDDTLKTHVVVTLNYANAEEYENAKDRLQKISEETGCTMAVKMQ